MLKELIMKGSEALDSADGFTIDRSKYLNASSAMSCIRKQWYERNVGPAEQDWGYARRGKQGELYIVDCLRASGAEVSRVGDEQVSIVSEEHRISATPDGFLHANGYVKQLEFKTIDPRANRSKLPKPDHVTQLQIAMELSHAQWDDFDYPKPINGILLYMDASNYNDIIEFEIERDTEILKRLAPRAKVMLTANDAAKLDREGKRTGECSLYGGCPYAGECTGAGAAANEPVTDSELEVAVRSYNMAKADEDEAKRRKADASETIKQRLEEKGVRSEQVGNTTVVLESVSGRTTIDWKAAERAGIDLEPFKKIGQDSERLTIK